jgi:predicted phage terminase large subunit-like protein
MANKVNLTPQVGPQTAFLATKADIAIYGGAAGGGKTYGLLLEPLRHVKNPKFGCVIFRRNTTQVRNEGGLWDESNNIYPLFNARPREATLEWILPDGPRFKFSHLEYDSTVFDWQGAAIALIGYDELTHFTEKQFFYMLSRNRSTCGVKPYIRATTNPDPDSWVRTFIDHWIDKDGYAIKERSGKIRWFIRNNDSMIWADSPQELYDQYGNSPEIQPKSVTFIAAKLDDNKILMEKDPAYLGNLLALSRVDRMRLKEGNWNVRATAGMMFKRDWFQVVDTISAGPIQMVRYWDRAATKPSESNRDPDWTRGIKLYKYADGTFIVVDLKSMRDTPLQIEQLIKNTASQDSQSCKIVGEQDPGSAGVADASAFTRMLSGFQVLTRKVTKDKVTRAKPVSAQCEAGNIRVLRAPWNEEFFNELENFPDPSTHDDIVDTLSGAFNELSTGLSICDVL